MAELLLTRVCVTALFAGCGAAVSQAAAPILPVCSWPFEVTGQGITNIATPDTNATYWVMPLDLTRWRAMVIHGQYPDARFFNFSTYTAIWTYPGFVRDESLGSGSLALHHVILRFLVFFGSAPGGAILPFSNRGSEGKWFSS